MSRLAVHGLSTKSMHGTGTNRRCSRRFDRIFKGLRSAALRSVFHALVRSSFSYDALGTSHEGHNLLLSTTNYTAELKITRSQKGLKLSKRTFTGSSVIGFVYILFNILG